MPGIAKPELVYPATEGTVGDDFYYQWKPVRLASLYRLDIGSTPTSRRTRSLRHVLHHPDHVHASDPKRDRACLRLGGRTYWRVQPLDDNRTGERHHL